MKKLLFISTIAFFSLAAYAQKQVSKTFVNVTTVEVEGAYCDVIIKAVPGNTVKFSGNIDSQEESPIHYHQTGSQVKIWVDSRREGNSEVYIFGIKDILNLIFERNHTYKGLLELEVPANTNVLVANTSGNISASNLTGKEIKLKASSGRIICTDIFSSLNVRTSSGSIRVNHVKGNLVSRSSSGSQRISEIVGSLNSVASSGSILIDDVEGKVVAYSSSGNVKLNGVKGAVDLKTTSGSIKGERITLTDNSSFRSSSGRINMSLNNADRLSYDLEAGSGRLKVGDLTSNGKLYLVKDQIWVKGRSSSGSQIFM